MIGGDLDLCLCSTGVAHHRRRLAHRQRLRPGRDGGRRNSLRHQWRHAAGRQHAGRQRSSRREQHDHQRRRLDRDGEHGFTGIGIFGARNAHHQQRRRAQQPGRGRDRFLPLVTPTVTVTGPGSTWNVGGFGLSVGGRQHRRARNAHHFQWRRRQCQRRPLGDRRSHGDLDADGDRRGLELERPVLARGRRRQLRLRSPDRNAHRRRRRRGQLARLHRHRPGQHAQSRHRRSGRRDQHAGDRQPRSDRRELHRHAHPGRRHFRPRHAEQGRRGHADPDRQQHLSRFDHGRRRHAVGERLDRQLRPHRQRRRHHRRQRHRSATPPSTAVRSRPATRSAPSPCRATW